MERVAPKNLHRHTVPILLLAAVFLAASVAAFSSYAYPLGSRTASRAFFTNLVSIKAGPNGLAHISLSDPQPVATRAPAPLKPMLTENTGQVAQLDAQLLH